MPFVNYSNLTSVTIPDTVTSVDAGAFFRHSDNLVITGGKAAEQIADDIGATYVSSDPLTISETSCKIVAGQAVTMTANKEITWSTSKKKVFNGLKKGSCVITITSSIGGTLTIKIKVK